MQVRIDGAFQVLGSMQHVTCTITKDNLFNILQACSRKNDLAGGRQVYSFMVQNSYESIPLLADYFIRLLATCGCLEEADKAFSYVLKPSVYTWTALISAHVNLGWPHTAIALHFRMQQNGTNPDRVVFLCIIKACSSIGALHYGRLIHHQVFDSGLKLDVVIGNTLVDMYAKCGSLEEARCLFDGLRRRTLVSWSALIAGYAQHGHVHLAYDFFIKMQREGFEPCKGMFLCILKACSCMDSVDEGMVIHDQIIRQGLEVDLRIGSSLIDVYSKCGCLEAAHKVFKMIPHPNIVSWGALINGYVQHGQGYLGLELFEQMQKQGFKPDKFLFTSVLKLCAIMGALEQGKALHKKVSRSGCGLDTVVGNALIDMYCKCGNLAAARKVLNELPAKDMASWGAMIAGYASYGVYEEAAACLEDMQNKGFKPDSGVFLNILTACSHAGLLEDGRRHFKAMINDHGITPSVEHYNCIVNLFGRAGRLNEAADLLHTMSAAPDIIGWRSLLAGSRVFKDADIGDHCFDEVISRNSGNASGYVLMSNVFAEASEEERSEKAACATKKPSRAWIEVSGKVCEFNTRDRCDWLGDELFSKLAILEMSMRVWGYVPEEGAVIEPEFKEVPSIDENLMVVSENQQSGHL